MLWPTQVLTEEQQSESRITKRKKKCHENRKLQHFKRKCRARGLTEEQIKTRIQNRNDTISERVHESCKRKRDDPSIQKSVNISTSISQAAVLKKTRLSQ